MKKTSPCLMLSVAFAFTNLITSNIVQIMLNLWRYVPKKRKFFRQKTKLHKIKVLKV